MTPGRTIYQWWVTGVIQRGGIVFGAASIRQSPLDIHVVSMELVKPLIEAAEFIVKDLSVIGVTHTEHHYHFILSQALAAFKKELGGVR